MTKDFTRGDPLGLIVRFAIPVILSTMMQQFYSLIDAMIVGRILGAAALGAVGSTSSVSFMVIGFCGGICSGFAIPMGQAFGARQEEELKRYIGNALWLCLAFATCLAVVTGVLCGPILRFMDTPDEIFDQAYAYIRVIFWGIPATVLYNMLACMIRSVGDSKTPVLFLGIASALNILLDLILIAGLGFGVEAAAAATILSQGVSGLLCLRFIFRRFPELSPEGKQWWPIGRYLRRLCYMGIPMGFQCSITGIGSVTLQAAVNSLGTVCVSAMAAAGKLNLFSGCMVDALGNTMAAFTSQNVGAGKIVRVRRGVRICLGLGAMYAVLVLAVFYFAGDQLIALFLDSSAKGVAEIQELAHINMVINALFYFPLVGVNVFRFCIQGMGYSQVAVGSGVFETMARVVVSLLFIPEYGYIAACFASPVAWVTANCFLIPVYSYFICRIQAGQSAEHR